jgi:hypothetical protein
MSRRRILVHAARVAHAHTTAQQILNFDGNVWDAAPLG